MSDVVFQGGISGVWYHFAGGDISRVSSYPTGGPAPFAGVAGTSTATATSGLTLPTPVDDMLLDQWLKVSKWHVAIHIDSPSSSITSGYVYDGEFDLATGANATIAYNSSANNFIGSFSATDPIDQEALKLGGVETRIGVSDLDHIMQGTPYPDPFGTRNATTSRSLSLIIRHGDWAWHGVMSKWCAGVTLTLDWSVLDEPEVLFDSTSVSLEPLPPEEADNCPAGYHWNGSSGTNAGNETDPLWTYGCDINAYSKVESAAGYIDPDMERADTLGIDANDYFQIGTFLGRPMYVRMNRVVGDEKWDAWQAAQYTTIDITAAEYYPLP